MRVAIHRRIAFGLLLLMAVAVSFLVGVATARESRIMPFWATPCAGVGPAQTEDAAAVAACVQEREAAIANPPVVREIDWIGAIGTGAIVLVAGGLVIGRLPRVGHPLA
jgi:hypothetical protein